jgi:hypothetical protein
MQSELVTHDPATPRARGRAIDRLAPLRLV